MVKYSYELHGHVLSPEEIEQLNQEYDHELWSRRWTEFKVRGDRRTRKPRRKCLNTKNQFRFSKQSCLACDARRICFPKTKARLKEKKKHFRTLPFEILGSPKLSSGAKFIGSVIWCAGNCKKIDPKGKDNLKAIRERGKRTECNLNHAGIMARWGRQVTDECLRQHLAKLERAGFIERERGEIYIDLKNLVNYDEDEILRSGRWESGLIIPAIIHQDGGLSDTEKIVISGLLAFPRMSIGALSAKIGISQRSVFSIKAKFSPPK
jgi:hypothetical protein